MGSTATGLLRLHSVALHWARPGGIALLLAACALSARAQDAVSTESRDARRQAFEARYQAAADRGEADEPLWRNRRERRLGAGSVSERKAEPASGGRALEPDAQGDRDALMALFQSTGGQDWFSKANWGSTKPLNEWSDVIVENGRVVRLTLSDNNLVGTLPQEIGDLTALQELELDGNRISGSLPSTMANLTALTRLDLDANRISGALPQDLGTLSTLVRLVIDDNLLDDLPDLSGASSSLLLAVRRNRLTFEDIEPSIGFFDFRYAPQLPVGEIQTRNVSSGAQVSLQVQVGGANNRYQWVRNGLPVPGARSDTFTLPAASTTDAAVYVLEITNTVATRPGASTTNLVLRTQPISLRVDGIGPSEAPVAAADSVRTLVDTPVVIDVLANDVDPEGDALSVTALQTVPSHGSATVNLNSTITYQPAASFEGIDSFSYVVDDGNGHTASAAVFIRVGTPTGNRAPIARADSASTDPGAAVQIAVLANDEDPDGDGLNLVGVTENPAHGTAVANPDQTITYAPVSGFSGDDAFVYAVSDGFLSSTARVTVRVGAANRPPTPVDDAAETLRDQSVAIDVLANDTDPDGDPLQVTGFPESPAHGSVSVLSDGRVAYVPSSSYVGSDTFLYAVSDGTTTATARVTVTVRVPPNPSPVARNDTGQTTRDTPVEVDVLANDTDPNGDPLSVIAVGVPLYGSATVTDGNLVRFVPADGYVGQVAFDYQISDGVSTSSAEVEITVGEFVAANHPPVANRDEATTRQGVAVSIPVLANDADLDFDPLTVVAVTLASHGTASVSGNQVRYAPNAGFVGTDQFSYQVTDGESGAVGQVEVTVTAEGGEPANHAPTARADAEVTQRGVALEIDVLANDEDADGDALTLVGVVRSPKFGTAAPTDTGRIRYAPHAGFLGTDILEYGVSDGLLVSKAVVTFDVGPPFNEPPTAHPDTAETTSGTAVTIRVLDNDTDEDGDALQVAGITRFPQFGSVTVGADRTLTYTPNVLLLSGVDRFLYAISDGTDQSIAEVTVTITVPGNKAPIARPDAVVASPGTPVEIDVLANDSDPDGQTLSVSSIALAPSSGLVQILPSGRVRYTPNASFAGGTDRFFYEVSDGSSTASALVTIRMAGSGEPVNAPPLAGDDTATTEWNTSVDIPVLANDTDPDGDRLAIVALGLAREGQVALVGDGLVRLTPASGFFGRERFTYLVTDGKHLAIAEVRVTVTATEPPNRTPVAHDDYVGTTTGTPVLIKATANDADLDGDPLLVTAATLASNGTAVVTDAHTITYTPAAGFQGTDSFSYQITDGSSGSVGQVFVNVSAAGLFNRTPVAGIDRASTPRGAPLTLSVLSNDTDPDGDALTLAGIFREPRSGRVEVTESGALRYIPNSGFAGADRFDYGVTDGVRMARGVVEVEVTAELNRWPGARDDHAEGPAGAPMGIDVLDNDTDPDGQTLTIAGLTEFPIFGTATVTSGEITYEPADGFAGEDSFVYRIRDGFAAAEARVTVSVYAPVPTGDDRLPTGYSLGANYPNPFNPVTSVPYTLPAASPVRIDVYDLTGRHITTLLDEYRPAGAHVVRFDARELSSGLYLIVMRSGDFVATGKLTLVK